MTPLGGLEYVDKVLGGAKGVEERAVVAVDGPAGEVDRVYFGAPDTLEVSYANASGGMEFTKTGLADVVVSAECECVWRFGEELTWLHSSGTLDQPRELRSGIWKRVERIATSA